MPSRYYYAYIIQTNIMNMVCGNYNMYMYYIHFLKKTTNLLFQVNSFQFRTELKFVSLISMAMGLKAIHDGLE
jgi:hypothetical protein